METNQFSSIGLADLIQPITVDDFINSYWLPCNPYLSAKCSDKLQSALALPELQTVESIASVACEEVILFCRDGFRATTPPTHAVECYERGDTLYFICLEQSIPELKTLRQGLANDFGVPDDSIIVEAFAAKSGGIATRHYDWDVNFQVLLQGRKRWKLEKNTNIENPDASIVPNQNWPNEALAKSNSVDNEFTDSAIELVSDAGNVLFLPRAMWHETYAETDCLSINFVLRPPMWHDLITQTIREQSHSYAESRKFSFGVLGSQSFRSTAEIEFQRQRKELLSRIQELRFDDLPLSLDHRSMRWRQGFPPTIDKANNVLQVTCGLPGSRVTVELPIAACKMIEGLAKLRHRFGLREASWFAEEMAASEVQAVLDEMLAREVLEIWQ